MLVLEIHLSIRLARLTGASMRPVEPKWQIVSQKMLTYLDGGSNDRHCQSTQCGDRDRSNQESDIGRSW